MGEIPRRPRDAEGATSPEPLRHHGPGGPGVSGDCGTADDRGGVRWPHAAVAPTAPARRRPMEFAQRHIGPSRPEQDHMLAAIGYGSLDELVAAALPPGIAAHDALALPAPLTEPEALAELRRLAGRNEVRTSMIGLGYYGTVTPAVIRRSLLENPAWYTAYTPYTVVPGLPGVSS